MSISAFPSYNLKINAISSDMNKYPAKQHAQSVISHLKANEGLICLPGSGLPNWEDSDQPKPFRQLRYFYYLSGCNESSCYLTYDITRDFLTLYIEPVVPTRVIWNGRGSTINEAKALYDVDEVKLTTCLLKDYNIWFRAHSDSTIYFLHAEPDPFIPRSASYLSSSSPTIDTTSLLPAIDASRTIKFPHEIALIRHANDISTKAHTAVLRSLRRFRNEREIAAQFTQTCMAHAAPQQSYEIIAGSGPNAAILHYVKNDEPLKGRQLVCLDAGAEYLNYSSDVTRTFPISGFWTKEAKSIHDLVQKMQNSCVERIKPGISYLDLYHLAHAIALTGLMDLGILHNGTEEEIKKSGAVSIFFPHGLGHHIGLEVHDVSARAILSSVSPPVQNAPANPHVPLPEIQTNDVPTSPYRLQSAAPLEPNMVVTVEPGIYFHRYAIEYYQSMDDPRLKHIDIELLEQYYPVGGVRIEDDILVTETGYENITTAPKGENMLDIIRDGWSTDKGDAGDIGRIVSVYH